MQPSHRLPFIASHRHVLACRATSSRIVAGCRTDRPPVLTVASLVKAVRGLRSSQTGVGVCVMSGE